MTSVVEETFLREAYPALDIGEGTYGLLSILTWDGPSKIHIGKYCSFGYNTHAFVGGEHRADWATTYPFSVLWPEGRGVEGHPASRGDVVIGNDVWVAAQATILSGSTIGDGAVVAARTLVSGAVAPYSVVGGNPMRFLRWRFPQPIREELLQIKWWDWPRERIAKALPVLLNPDIERFIYLAKRGEL